jgi:hypothetical protein
LIALATLRDCASATAAVLRAFQAEGCGTQVRAQNAEGNFLIQQGHEHHAFDRG